MTQRGGEGGVPKDVARFARLVRSLGARPPSASQSTYRRRNPEKKMVKPRVRRFTTRPTTMQWKPFSLKYE